MYPHAEAVGPARGHRGRPAPAAGLTRPGDRLRARSRRARAVATRLDTGHILAIDRSAAAIDQAKTAAADQIACGRLTVRDVAAEELLLEPGEAPYDLVFAIRVGALDGRHSKAGEQVLQRIDQATTPRARLFINGDDPFRELPIPRR
jgi:hypothetical protein